VFGDLDSRVQTFGRVVRQNRDITLRDDVPMIYFVVDVMHRATGNGLARIERLLPRFQSGNFGKSDG